MQFGLLHSPLVGPSTWAGVAAALQTAGHEVVVPDLRASATTGRPEAVVDAAAAAIPQQWSTPVLVAHSGAGAIVPSVADQLGERAVKMVFVDAGLPPCEGDTTAGPDFLDQLRGLAVDGILPKWSTWWGSGVMESLVPDAARRTAIEAEMPSIPLAFYESPFAVPDGWCDSGRGSFLLLSEPYRQDATRARELGWPTIERPGGHLDIVNEPGAIARSIVEIAT